MTGCIGEKDAATRPFKGADDAGVGPKVRMTPLKQKEINPFVGTGLTGLRWGYTYLRGPLIDTYQPSIQQLGLDVNFSNQQKKS